jgi:sec-independent protein translocase protein TatA
MLGAMFEGLLSPAHLLIVLVIALIVLGPKRLPEAGRGLGEAIRGFKDSIAERPDAHRDEVAAPREPSSHDAD